MKRLAAARPDLAIYLNGGIVTCEDAVRHIDEFDGVMIGRAAYKSPLILADISEAAFGRAPVNRLQVIEAMADYIAAQLKEGASCHNITRHMLGFYNGFAGARAWRRCLGEEMRGADNPDLMVEAVAAIEAKQAERDLVL